MRKGAIIVNPFLIPIESVHQANRLKEEFLKLNVETDIISDGYLKAYLKDGKFLSSLSVYDFIIYLDKDKYLSEILSKTGVPLFNSHQSIRVCDDKAQTILALAEQGVNLPDTIFGSLCYLNTKQVNVEGLKLIGERLGYPLIVKESFGSMGKGVYKADNLEELTEIAEKVKLKPHLFQKYIWQNKGTDIRVIVIGKKVVCAMKRHNANDFRSNIALGGTGSNIELSEPFINTAERVAEVLGLDYCGVDLLIGENNTPYVCEVNSNAFFNEIESVTGVNVAKTYAEYVIEKVY